MKSLTPEQILEYRISQDINQWLHEKGDDVHNYQIFLDRVCEIAKVVRQSFEQIKEIEGNEDGQYVRIAGEGWTFSDGEKNESRM